MTDRETETKMINAKYRAKPQPTEQDQLNEKILHRASELYNSRGGAMIEQMQNTMGLVLQDFTNQMRNRVESLTGEKPLVSAFVALRYMKENKALEAERVALREESLAQAKQELDPQPTEMDKLMDDNTSKIVAECVGLTPSELNQKIEAYNDRHNDRQAKPLLLLDAGGSAGLKDPEPVAEVASKEVQPIKLE